MGKGSSWTAKDLLDRGFDTNGKRIQLELSTPAGHPLSSAEDIFFAVTPVSKPRMTRSDQWKTGEKKRKPVAEYHEYKDAINALAAKYSFTVPSTLSLTFVLPIPKTLRKKKNWETIIGKPVQVKPDLDNLIKAFKDALCDNDSYVWEYRTMKKIYGIVPGIIVHKTW